MELEEEENHQQQVAEGGEQEEEKPRTIFVGNIPKQVTKRDLESVFGDVGPLKRCFIQYPRNDGKFRMDETTVAYVTYALPEDAVKAVENLQSYTFGSNKVLLKFAKSRSQQYREPRGRTVGFDWRNAGASPASASTSQPQPRKEKRPREKRPNKKSRLIIRNLSFQTNEAKIRETFSTYGGITDVNILKKANGKLVGCAFVQYENFFQAAKALKELNMKPFLGRPIAIDWALPKGKFQDENNDQEVKQEAEVGSGLDHDVKVKVEPLDSYENNYDYVEQSETIKIEDDDDLGKSRKRKGDISDSDNYDSEDDEENESKSRKKQKLNFKDADDGKTLFMRNLDFDITQDELKDFFENFGKLNYAVICKDKLTEHPKGTAFVMFRDATDASNCLDEYERDPAKFTLRQRQFIMSLAISREKLESKLKEKDDIKKQPKDNRNLYLGREGFIRPGTNAAIGVSAADMNRRTAIQRVKKQMLKNLNTFVSDVRLCVHNLPPTLTDKDLRRIFYKHGGPGSRITEARIMRNLQETDMNGVGTSKEYGFVTFTNHEHALKALRTVNNNPKIFTVPKRPIVEFSLENRAAIKAKEKRLGKSREKNVQKQQVDNQSLQDNNDTDSSQDENANKKKGKKRRKAKKLIEPGTIETTKNKPHSNSTTEEELPTYSGLKAKTGVLTLPSLKPKGKITRKSLKPAKFKRKKLQERKVREPQIKPKTKGLVDKIDKMVSKYKEKSFVSEPGNTKKQKGKKWYE